MTIFMWEAKRVTFEQILKMPSNDMQSILENYRDWMLGGPNYEWRYHKDPVTGDLILERENLPSK